MQRQFGSKRVGRADLKLPSFCVPVRQLAKGQPYSLKSTPLQNGRQSYKKNMKLQQKVKKNICYRAIFQ
jgi:hypothetical protein